MYGCTYMRVCQAHVCIRDSIAALSVATGAGMCAAVCVCMCDNSLLGHAECARVCLSTR